MNDELRKNTVYPVSLMLVFVASMIVALYFQGRVWWCSVGDLSVWSSEIWTTHNSQHFVDPYTFTHILHGILYFWLAQLFFGKLPLGWRFVLVVSIECGWEILENSNFVIERYRSATISLDYYGDSILNSLADVLSCSLGAFLAYKLNFWRSLLYFVLTEVLLLFWIRDNLTLNVIMLIYPIEMIKNWQSGS